MKAQVVAREVFVPSPGAGVGVMGGNYYTTLDGGNLMSIHNYTSRSDTVDVAFVRRSEDNGRTWSEPVEWPPQVEHPRCGTLVDNTARIRGCSLARDANYTRPVRSSLRPDRSILR
jgi:hypothetical protein